MKGFARTLTVFDRLNPVIKSGGKPYPLTHAKLQEKNLLVPSSDSIDSLAFRSFIAELSRQTPLSLLLTTANSTQALRISF